MSLTDTLMQQLIDANNGITTSYLSDFERDRTAIAGWEGSPTSIPPFIHFAYNYGTYLSFLHPANAYPVEGETVPYLFGTAGRHELLAQAGAAIDYAASHSMVGVCMHYDGRALNPITLNDAVTIVRHYKQDIAADFDRAAFHSKAPRQAGRDSIGR